jgi:20S proteasome alpha/beta subunit
MTIKPPNRRFRQIERRVSFNPKFRERSPVTVCVATLFRWNYAPPGKPEDLGAAALVASDRMITAGDVEYEPNQLKVAYISKNAVIVIAGQYPMHSQALKEMVKRADIKPETPPETIANLYGKAIQKIRMQLAEDAILAPFGMNTDTFIAQQRDMSQGFVDRITTQMQEFQGPSIEALVIGMDFNQAEIWGVDYQGTIRCYDDVGFNAIGIGAGHASLALMQVGYTNSWRFPDALAATYNAKKVAETAPGVGTHTDIHLIGRHGWATLWDSAFTAVGRLYNEFLEKQAKLRLDSIAELSKHLFSKEGEKPDGEAGQQSSGKDAQADAGPSSDAAEAPRGNEDEETGGSKEADKEGS